MVQFYTFCFIDCGYVLSISAYNLSIYFPRFQFITVNYKTKPTPPPNKINPPDNKNRSKRHYIYSFFNMLWFRRSNPIPEQMIPDLLKLHPYKLSRNSSPKTTDGIYIILLRLGCFWTELSQSLQYIFIVVEEI